MRPIRILILGGYGNTGRRIARLLLTEYNTALDVCIAGRNQPAAQQLVDELQSIAGSDHMVRSVCVDAADLNSLRSGFQDVDLVVVASSTMQYCDNVVRAALHCNCDYLDTQLSAPEKHAVLRHHASLIQTKRRLFITDGGFHPGVPAAMVRYVLQPERADHSSTVPTQLRIFAKFQMSWKQLRFSPATVREFTTELKNFEPIAYDNGDWKRTAYRTWPRYNFGAPFHQKAYCVPTFLEELREPVTEYSSIRGLGFYMAGFGTLVDWFVMPLCFLLLPLFPAAAARLLYWALRQTDRKPYGALLSLEGADEAGNRVVQLDVFHPDPYDLTAIPVVACLEQYLDGSFKSRYGIHCQANIVEPLAFMRRMQAMGVTVQSTLAG